MFEYNRIFFRETIDNAAKLWYNIISYISAEDTPWNN